jgi:hypothetical protein
MDGYNANASAKGQQGGLNDVNDDNTDDNGNNDNVNSQQDKKEVNSKTTSLILDMVKPFLVLVTL